MLSDLELEKTVMAELEFESSIQFQAIEASAKGGIVTLKGSVSTYAEKLAAVRGVKRLAGVRAIEDDIVVKLPKMSCRADSEIAATAAGAIQWITTVPANTVKVTVCDGWLSLKGAVDGRHQKQAAEKAVRNLTGVKGLTNLIAINPKATTSDVEGAIKAAFERHALLNSQRIQVNTTGGKVVLSGNVRTSIEGEEAERAAWAAQGVTNVENNIVLTI
jgi:osmotically-inducible protein OsmY